MSPPQSPPESVLAVLAEGYPPVPAVLNSDGDQHQRLRTLVETALRSGLKGMRAHLHAKANALVDACIEYGRSKTLDKQGQMGYAWMGKVEHIFYFLGRQATDGTDR